jgi:hypothetical protein
MTSRKVEEENVTSEWQRVYDAMRDPSLVCGRCTHLVTCTVNRGVYRQIVYDYPQVAPDAVVVEHYNSTLALNRIRYSKRVHDNEVIDPRFQLLLQLKLIRVRGNLNRALRIYRIRNSTFVDN